MNLAGMPPGTRAHVASLYGGRELQRRLMEMGLVPGSLVEVVSNNNRGPVIIRVRGVIIALGRGMASRIIVEPF